MRSTNGCCRTAEFAFNAALRKVILAAADSRRVQSLVRRHGMRLGAARFVAGETLDDCVPVLRRLNDQGLYANTTLLGEGVLEPGQTDSGRRRVPRRCSTGSPPRSFGRTSR